MKPTTEDFLIPLADVLRSLNEHWDIDYVEGAAKLRIRYAIAAKAVHDEECQRLADEWVQQNKAAYFQRQREYSRNNISKRGFEYDCNLDIIWNSMRHEADSIFRDYISKQRPTE